MKAVAAGEMPAVAGVTAVAVAVAGVGVAVAVSAAAGAVGVGAVTGAVVMAVEGGDGADTVAAGAEAWAAIDWAYSAA